jgi:flagellar hook-associated protein 1 FlgK
MGINFSPFDIGQRALRASQMGLTVTGQNIANVNTPGYTRQEVVLSATPPTGANLKLTGTGVTIEDVRSLRDQFIQTRMQTETGISGRLLAQRDALSAVDATFTESAGSINSALTNFFGAFRDLETNPTSIPLRTAVVESGSQLGAAFSSTRGRLVSIRTEADNQLRATVDSANGLAARVADLNTRIRVAEGSGANASELRDQRDEAINSLAELTGARTTTNQDGTLTITLGDGRPLVLSDRPFTLKADSAPPDGLAQITLDGQAAVISNGRLRGLADAIGFISSQIGGLDDLAASVADRVNTLHATGADLNGVAGTDFFAQPSGGGPITAANLAVSAAIKADPRLVAAGAQGAGTGDASVARDIAGLFTDTTSQAGTRTGSFTTIFAQLVSEAGGAVKTAEDALATQQVILAQTVEQRNAMSGVSLDEEAVNLLRYQRAFEAAARFLKVADEITQTVLALGQ